MNESKPQKILVGIVAISVLGFGGYWVVGSDSRGDGDKSTKIAITDHRKERPPAEVTPEKPVRKPSAKRAEAPKVTVRKRREVRKADTTERRPRVRGQREKVKKEVSKPMG